MVTTAYGVGQRGNGGIPPPGGMTTTLPPTLARKVSGTGIKGSRVPRYKLDSPLGEVVSGTSCSANVSVTSTRLLVDPQAIQRLYPWMTPGTPAKVLPNTGSPPLSRPMG